MYLALIIEPPIALCPHRYKRSGVATRYTWLWFCLKVIHVSEHEYATTSYDWRD